MISNQGYGICHKCRIGEMRPVFEGNKRVAFRCTDCKHEVRP